MAIDRSAFERHETAIAVLLNDFFLRHMLAVYQAFDGDLLEAIVLGEVAHHNLSAITRVARTDAELGKALARVWSTSGSTLLPTNAHAIATATAIPRETVRRKVAALVSRNWLVKDEAANLVVTDDPLVHFSEFNFTSLLDLLDTAERLAQVVRCEPHRRRRPKAARGTGHGSGLSKVRF